MISYFHRHSTTDFRPPAIRIFARIAGLPTTFRAHWRRLHKPAAVIRFAYAKRFWTIRTGSELLELIIAILLAVPVFLLLSLSFLWRNGALVASQFHRPIHRQFLDHVDLYLNAGVLPPWYYIYELYRIPGKRHARNFLYRWESKNGVLALLKEVRVPSSVVSDKVTFAEQCGIAGVPTVPILGFARQGEFRWLDTGSRSCDLFVKPVGGKGGKGIERLDKVDKGRWRDSTGAYVTEEQLIRRLIQRSIETPYLIQPRIENHADLSDLNNGALATVRALTCLDERGSPELVGAVFRMAIGANRVVDNLHAGGIVAGIDHRSGRLSAASNLGNDVRLGWLKRHPTSGAPIEGRILPFGDRIRPFAERAHQAFADRVVIGWDIAVGDNGLVVVEANGSPDLDIMQRSIRRGLIPERLGTLLAHHLGARVAFGSGELGRRQ